MSISMQRSIRLSCSEFSGAITIVTLLEDIVASSINSMLFSAAVAIIISTRICRNAIAASASSCLLQNSALELRSSA